MKTILLLLAISLLLAGLVRCDGFSVSGSGAYDITIMVKEGGMNVLPCLNGAVPCLTLNYVLNNLEKVESAEISVYVLYSHTISSVRAVLTTDVSLKIRGENQSVVSCQEGSQVVMDAEIHNASVAMEISYMQFTGCGSAISRTPSFRFISFCSVEFKDCGFSNCSDLVIDSTAKLHVDGCRFESNTFFTSALQLSFDGDLNLLCIHTLYSIDILNSIFVNNADVESMLARKVDIIGSKSSIVGAYIKHTKTHATNLDLIMDNCSFSGSRALNASGLTFTIAGSVDVVTLTVTKSSFVGMNTGGHLISINASGRIDGKIAVDISDTSAISNTFSKLRGVMNFDIIGTSFSGQNPLIVSLSNNTVKNNSGSIGLRFKATNLATPIVLRVMDSIYSNNRGTAINIGCVDCQEQSLLTVRIHEVVISGNRNLMPLKRSTSIVIMDHCELHIKNTNFTNNIGTAAELTYVDVYFQGDLFFDGNLGTNGGACKLGNNVNIIPPSVDERVSVQLSNNIALYGGAFYLTALTIIRKPFLILTLKQNCNPNVTTVGGEDSVDNTVMVCNFTLAFNNNTATISGDNAFVVEPSSLGLCNETCIEPISGVASSAKNVTIYGSNNTNILTIFPGQNILVNTTVKDLFNLSATCEATVFLQCGEDILICGSGGNTVQLFGTGQLTLTNTPSISPLQITSANGSLTSNPTLVFQCQYAPQAVLVLNVTSCPNGFVYNSTTRKCQCALSDSDVYVCSALEGVACVAQNHWFGYVTESDGNTSKAVVSYCPYPLCTPSYNECPIQNATSSSPVPYILLPFSSDEQCAGDRGGPLCKECANGATSTFEAALCIPDDKCEPWQPYVLIFLAVIFQLLLSLALMYIVRYFKEIGLLYGPLFFVAVINHLPFGYYLKFYELKVILSIFSSYLLVDFAAFGQIPWCFYLETLPSFSFQFLGPLILALLLFLNILCAKLCPRLLKHFNIPPIQTVCFLTMLSFWTLADTSISILQGQSFGGVEGTYVYVQPSILYFTGVHIVLVLVSVSLLAFVILPFVGLLLLAPLIGKKFAVNLSHVQPFLDVFQSPFKDEFRWYPAVYFITWMLFLATDTLEINLVPQIMVMIMATLQFVLLPFKRVHLNAMNSLLLFDIVLIIFFLNEQGNTHVYFYNQASLVTVEVIVYGLTLAPLLYFLLALASIILYKTGFIRSFSLMRRKNGYEHSINESNAVDLEDSVDDRSVSMRRVSFRDVDVDLRESLLESFH